MLVLEADYAAGDVFTMSVGMSNIGLWSFGPDDYTVKVYSKQDIPVLDSKGNTNELNFDGSSPSGFTGRNPYSTS